jgi:eukaryotic-like serine/threonine-protein kinase
MSLSSGTRLGHYEILAPLGAGGMGEVYRARDFKLGRDVALKVLPDAFARDPDRMARFQREAKILASLSHPNIAAIYGLEDSDRSNALVMELVEGPTLAYRIKQGPVPIDEALRVAKQICEGLEYAHERGIVHRDLKPANIKVRNDDVVKVLDFGLAKALEGDAHSPDISDSPTVSHMATQAGILLGTAAYMSPEQARGKSVDRRADIWAFACVFFEMLTGKSTFVGETVSDTLAAVIKEEPNWAQLPAGTPVRVRVLLQRCLHKDPKQRLRDIGEARISLEEVLAGAPEQSSGTVASASVSRGTLPWALFAAAIVVLAALVFVRFREKPLAAEAVRFQIPLPEKAVLGPAGSFAVSPDGRELAFFAAAEDGVPHLWIRPLDSLEGRPLPDSGSTSNPAPFFWSPDSHYIAFDAGTKLKKIAVSGGPAQTLCDISGNAVGGSWNKDGVIIFGQSPGGIMRVSASGGPPSLLTTLDPSRGETDHSFPSFLPDGRHFLYLRRSAQPENNGVYVGSLDVKPEEQDSRRLLPAAFQPMYVPSLKPESGQLLFMSEAKLQVQPFDVRRLQLTAEPVSVAEQVGSYRDYGFFSVSTNGVLVYRAAGAGNTVLTWFDRQGKALGTMEDRGDYATPAFSPDGSRAAIGRVDPVIGNWIIWIFDFARGTSARFTFGSASAWFPVWSPDGKRIIFASDRRGLYDLYQKSTSGATEQELLLTSNENKYPTSVSPDGRFLLYSSYDSNNKFSLWVLPLGGNAKPIPFPTTEFKEIDGRFSPDGHFIAYRSDESGRFELYVRKFTPDLSAAGFSTSGKWQVSYGGAVRQRWSADGKELFYVTPDGKVMAAAVTLSPAFQAGTPKLLFQAPAQPGRPNGDITADGRRFLFPVPAGPAAQPPFTVVLNWQAGLKN